ncbi:MAG: UvrD-helicase domain-containing protein, partial [Thermoguttaceae bacterium]
MGAADGIARSSTAGEPAGPAGEPVGAPLTGQQSRALAARGVSVALSAGAGCGKTLVLTERFLAGLEPDGREDHGPRLEGLTAITFTERAAREMRDRIRTACTRRLLEAPEKEADYWLRTIRELDAARISTIHSFCGSLLRAHAVEARLDPQFRVLDQAAADTLVYELIDREIRDRLARRDDEILDLAADFGLTRLVEMARDLLANRQEIDWDLWRGETADGLVARWEEFWRTDTLPRVLARIGGSPAAADLLDILRCEMPSHPVMRARCEQLVERLAQLLPSPIGRGAGG